jgi:hypothetical protein
MVGLSQNSRSFKGEITMMRRPSPRRILALALSVWLITSFQLAHAQTTVAGFTPGQFQVTETGAASYTIPIQVPPGTAGMEPKLSLVYNSQGGNGLLGVGWSLGGLSAITRCPRTVAQDGVKGGINYNANDRFCLDGQRLIAIGGTYGGANTEYRTERASFAKIVSYGQVPSPGNGPQWFKVWTKSGQVMEFGNTVDSAIEAQGNLDQTLNDKTVRVWAVNKISDTKGNYITVSYTEDKLNGDYYPIRIDYTGNGAQTPYNSVDFSYAPRSDVIPLYEAGSMIKPTQRLIRIQTYAGALVRAYNLTYDNNGAGDRSRLISMQECGSGGVCLPATTFSWQPSGSYTPAALQNGQFFLGHPYGVPGWVVTGDFNGDGRHDVAIFNSTADRGYTIGLSNGDGTFTKVAQGQSFLGFPYGSPQGTVAVTAFDYDGDGKQDLLFVNNSGDGWYMIARSNGDGTFASVAQSQFFLGHPYGVPGWVVTGDFNGDGRHDVAIFNSTPDRWYTIGLSNGDGTFTKVAQSQNFLGFPYGSPQSTFPIIAADFNQDGRSDLAFFNSSPDRWYMFALSNGDGTFRNLASGQSFLSFPYGSPESTAAIIPIDSTGDGGLELLFFNNSGDGWYEVAQIYNGAVPDMLASISNGVGATTSITRKPLTDSSVYTKDSGASYPVMDVQSPIYVVSSVAADNGVGGTFTTNNFYAGAKVHLQGRGFLGFRMVQATDPQGLKSTTTFRQDWPYVGLPSQVTKQQPSGAILNQVYNTFSCLNPATGAACTVAIGNRYFPYVSQSAEVSYDLNEAAMPMVITTNAFDSYGNATQIVVSTNDGLFNKTTTNTYSNDTANWFLGRLTRSTVASTAPDTPVLPPRSDGSGPTPSSSWAGVYDWYYSSFYYGDIGPGSAGCTFRTDGVVSFFNTGGTHYFNGSSPVSGIGANYWIRAVLDRSSLSGNYPGANLNGIAWNTWYQINVNRDLYVVVNSVGDSIFGNVYVELSFSNGGPVVAAGTITLSAWYDDTE